MALALDRFSQRLAESGLLSETEVVSLIETLPADRRPQDGEQLARLLVKQKKLTVYQAQQIYAGKGRSLVLGNYVVLDKLGQGGMGTVLKAVHRRMERMVAIKVLSPAVVNRPGALPRFQREVKMAARLEHPNIVTAYDADDAGGMHFMVMQYVDGTDLAQLVQQYGPLPPDLAVSYGLQAARGLDYAHCQGIIHRDVKPSNLLIDQAGVVKVLDMGLARVDVSTDEQDPLTLSGQIMGTVDYMAPEQALDTRAADARADIYSLGATLWFLMTGRAMYPGESIMQKLRAHDCAPIPVLTEQCLGVTPELETIFRTMVAKRPEQRYQTMAEVVAVLEKCLEVLPATSPSVQDGRGLLRPSTSQAGLNFASAPGSLAGTGRRPSPIPAQASTIYHRSQVDTDPNTHNTITRPSGSTRTPTQHVPVWQWRGRNLYLALAGCAAVLLTVLVSYVLSKEGTICVEIGDPQIQVAIKGTDIVFSQAGGKQEISLSPGEKTLVVKQGDFAFETDAFTLREGETVAIRVQLLDGQVVVQQGARLLGAEMLPGQSPAGKLSVTGGPAKKRQMPPLAVAPFNALKAKQYQHAWAQYLGIPIRHAIKLADGVELPLVLIPPGEFLMGSSAEQVEAVFKSSTQYSSYVDAPAIQAMLAEQMPQHPVKLTRPYLIGATEVTIGQFKAFAKATGYLTRAEEIRAEAEANPTKLGKRPISSFRTYWDPGHPITDDYPATQINWNDAQAFCRWLNRQAAAQLGEDVTLIFRLPTEAEWEFACRAGTQTLFFFGDNPAPLRQFVAHYGSPAQRVAALRPNAFGLYDMHGSVSEWCSDWYDPKWYEISPATDPVGPDFGTRRAIRGGNRLQSGQYRELCAARQGQTPDLQSSISAFGFRLAATITLRGASQPAQQTSRPWQGNSKPLSSPEQRQAFIDHVARLPAEQQVVAVAEMLKEVNPGFDSARTYKIADGKVVEYGMVTVHVSDIWPLKALTDLKVLAINGTAIREQLGKVESLEPLAGLRLEELSCSHNQRLHDLTPLAGMPLKKLNISLTAVADLSPLNGLPLEELSVVNTNVEDLSPLAGMPLTRLWMGYTQVSDLRPLRGMPLIVLNCSKTPIADLSPLRGLKITSLNLSDCKKLTDISPLADLPLIGVTLQNSSISDLSPLRGKSVSDLYCDNTPVTDLTPLKGMPLRTLSIKGIAVTDLSPLQGASLENLYIDFVPRRDEAVLRSMKELRYINRIPVQQFWQAVREGKTP